MIELPPDQALQHSSYGRFVDGHLLIDGKPAPRMAEEVHGAFRALLHDPDFPCVGAKSIVNQYSYRFGLYTELASPGATAGLAHDLVRFIEERPSIEGDFSSYIATFVEPKVMTPKEFEALLWRQLAALHELDKPHHVWSPAASADPGDPKFAFSFAEHAFFVVGLSPASQRWARHFSWPTLVFNDHAQFDRLREELRFDRIRDVIRGRDEALHGAPNDMLSDYGTHSEARQYAGRRVGQNWRCPVHFD
jgi:FPC/CPF motif-containing protein YcgG